MVRDEFGEQFAGGHAVRAPATRVSTASLLMSIPAPASAQRTLPLPNTTADNIVWGTVSPIFRDDDTVVGGDSLDDRTIVWSSSLDADTIGCGASLSSTF
jgi:hypothetical protein